MKREEKIRYEAILLNSITKEGSKWKLKPEDKHQEGPVYYYRYVKELPNDVELWATIEYYERTHEYRVLSLMRFGKIHYPGWRKYSFRWLDRYSSTCYLETN